MNLPSCPRCTLNDRVEAMPPPEPRRGRPLLNAESPWPWECRRCVLLFTGSDDEFVRMYQMREEYRENQKRRQMPPGLDAVTRPNESEQR